MTTSTSHRTLGVAVAATLLGMISVLGRPIAADAQTHRPDPRPTPGHQAQRTVNPYIWVYTTGNDSNGHDVLVHGTGFSPGGRVDVWGLCQCDSDPNNGQFVEQTLTASTSGEVDSVFHLQCATGDFYGYARDEATNTQSNAPKTYVGGCLW